MIQDVVSVAQVVTAVAVLMTLLVYFFQLRAMQEQLRVARDASRVQNLLSLIAYIQKEEHRDARATLITLRDRPVYQWTDAEKRGAERACSSWDVVGIILRDGGLPGARPVILDAWSHSIAKCWEAGEEFVRELRLSRQSNYWCQFEALAVDVRQQPARQPSLADAGSV